MFDDVVYDFIMELATSGRDPRALFTEYVQRHPKLRCDLTEVAYEAITRRPSPVLDQDDPNDDRGKEP